MKICKQFVVSTLLLCMLGCGNDNELSVSANYITEYVYNATRLDLISIPGNANAILLLVDGERTRQGEVVFNNLAGKLKDITFNKSIDKCCDVPCISESPGTINFITNQDYDAMHRAGSNINELVNISYHLPHKVIASGYDLGVKTRITESLLEFNRKIPHSLAHTFEFDLMSLPQKSGGYSFTIEYRKGDNTVLTHTIENMLLDAKR